MIYLINDHQYICYHTSIYLHSKSNLLVIFITLIIVYSIKGMGRRWIAKEEDALVEIRKRMKHELSSCPQFPEGIMQYCNITTRNYYISLYR